MARARGEERDELRNAAGQKTPPRRAASTVYFSLDDDGDVLAARSDRLLYVRPQDRFLRRTVEQNVDAVTLLSLDVPEPQMGNQLVEVPQKIDTRTSHQVIEVVKIFPDRVPQRLVESRPPQMAEQLVEVPTIMSFISPQQQTAEQIVDIPVPHRRRRGQGGLQGFRPGQKSTARFVEQNVDIPVPGGGLHDLPDPGGSSSSAVSRDERGTGGFRAFPLVKKSPKSAASPSPRVPARSSSGLRRLMRGCRPGTSTTSTSSTTAPCGSRLGTTSTGASVGAKSAVTMAVASCRCTGSQCLNDLEPPRHIVMAL